MVERFDACLAFTLHEEGGYTNDQYDPGGATNQGITLATFRAFRHDPVATVAELKNIGKPEVRAIYAVQYWHPPQCDKLPAGVDLMVFDMGVNSGPRRSAMILQQVLGLNLVDGWVGPATLARLATMKGADVVHELSLRQKLFYQSLDGFNRYGDGWLARLGRRTHLALG